MNPFLHTQTRIRDILTGTPALSDTKVLIEDKEGLQYLFARGLAPIGSALISIGTAYGNDDDSPDGALIMRETHSLYLVQKPIFKKEDAALPTDLLTTILLALHGAPLHARDRGPGAPRFFVSAHRLADAADGTVTYEITVTSPLVLVPDHAAADTALRGLLAALLSGDAAAPVSESPAGIADYTLRATLDAFLTGDPTSLNLTDDPDTEDGTADQPLRGLLADWSATPST